MLHSGHGSIPHIIAPMICLCESTTHEDGAIMHDDMLVASNFASGVQLLQHDSIATCTSTRFFSSGTLDLRASCNTAMACGIRMRVIASPSCRHPPGASRNAALAPHSMSESMASLAPHSRSPGLRGLGVRPFSSLHNSHCSVMFTSHASCGAIPQWARTAARRTFARDAVTSRGRSLASTLVSLVSLVSLASLVFLPIFLPLFLSTLFYLAPPLHIA